MANEAISEFFQNLEKKYPDWEMHSTNTLVFAYQLGLSPDECMGMYPESDWEEEWIKDYDRDYDLIDKYRYGTSSIDPR